jgi:hypothetical protein
VGAMLRQEKICRDSEESPENPAARRVHSRPPLTALYTTPRKNAHTTIPTSA